jgi:hypothetical protein
MSSVTELVALLATSELQLLLVLFYELSFGDSILDLLHGSGLRSMRWLDGAGFSLPVTVMLRHMTCFLTA